MIMVSTPLKRNFIPYRQVEAQNKDVDLSRHEGFKLQQRCGPAAAFWRRFKGMWTNPGRSTISAAATFTLNSANGEIEMIQGVTQITPEYLKIIGPQLYVGDGDCDQLGPARTARRACCGT